MSVKQQAKAALVTVSGELGALRKKQAAARGRIEVIDAEIRQLRQQGISLEDFKGFLAKFVEQRGEAYENGFGLGAWFNRPGTGRDESQLRPWDWFEGDDGAYTGSIAAPAFSSLDGDDAFGAFCCFAPELVTAKLAAHIQQLAGDEHANADAVPVAVRRQLIAKLLEERAGLSAEVDRLSADLAEFSQLLGA